MIPGLACATGSSDVSAVGVVSLSVSVDSVVSS